MKQSFLFALLITAVSCGSPTGVAQKDENSTPSVEFFSRDRLTGMFFFNKRVSSGVIVYYKGKIVEKGVESNMDIVRAENPSAKCIMGDRFAIAMPTDYGITDTRAQCWFGQFEIRHCDKPASCDDYLVEQLDKGVSPKWYSYSKRMGVRRISDDPRGIEFNTYSVDTQMGLK